MSFEPIRIVFVLFYNFIICHTFVLFKTTMAKGIVSILKYDQQNCTYPPRNTTFVIPQHSYIFIQTQRNSASVGAHDVTSSVLYQITNHHGSNDVKYNDYSWSFD